MNSFKIAIVTGALAVVAVIATVLILSLGNSGSGLYVSAVSGGVVLSSSEDAQTEPLAAEVFLKSGDVITVSEGASCTLVYRTNDNTDENYIILEPSTQVFVTGKFEGKADDELYLNRGSVLVSSMNEAKRNVIFRTENSSVTTKGSALRISYILDENGAYSTVASFGGSSKIQMYDSLGNAIDRDGNRLETPQPEDLGAGLSVKINSGTTPAFEYLNIPTVLADYDASVLRELLTISAFYELSFAPADIKAAYDNAPTDAAEPEQAETTSVSQITTVTEAATVTTEITESQTTEQTTVRTEPPVTTTTAAQTTAAQTTTAQTTVRTETQTAAQNSELITVYIIVDDEIYTQEVPYGSNAEQPADPVIEGRKFVGWDGSFNNITEETTISAIFEDDSSAAITTVTTTATETSASDGIYLTVTVVVNSQPTTQQVKYGESAVLPAVSVPGYIFMGWDRSADNITQNCTITAILLPDTNATTTNSDTVTYTVTFMVDGVPYPVTVVAGQSAVAPIAPTTNSKGQIFIGWDTDFSRVNSNLTVNAMFF